MRSGTSDSLVRNTLFSGISRGSDVVFLFLLIVAARYLGDEGYGQFSFAYSFVSLLEFTTDFGLREYLVREIARDKSSAKRFMENALTLKAVLSVLTAVLTVNISLIMPINDKVRCAIYLLTLSMIFRSFKFLFRSVMVAHEQFDREAYSVMTERCVMLALGGGALVLAYGLLPFAATFVLANGVGLAVVVILVRDKIAWPIRLGADYPLIKSLLWRSLPFGLSSAAFMLYFRLDSIMLGLLRNDIEVGWYNAAFRISEGLIIIPIVLYNVLFPRLSVLHEESRDAVQLLVEKGCRYLLALAVPISLIGIMVADALISIIYGPQYVESAFALRILLLSTGFMFVWLLLVTVLNSINHPVLVLVGVICGAVINTGLNLVLIPRYGYLGTSVSTVVADFAVFGVLYLFVIRCGYRLKIVSATVKPLTAALCAGIVFATMSGVNVFVLAAIGGLVYAGVLLALMPGLARRVHSLRKSIGLVSYNNRL